MKPQLTLIAAMDQNLLLANEHRIPWHLPRDIAHFRKYTNDKWLLLGRRTFEEMRGWFRVGHTPLVLTRHPDYVPQIGRAVATIDEALDLAAQAGQAELVCVGGAQVFDEALPRADRLILTLVQGAFPTGKNPVYFPQWSQLDWNIVAESNLPSDAENAFAMQMLVMERAILKRGCP